MELFEPASIGPIQVKNRLVMPPMCMYAAKNDGLVLPFHLHHYATRAVGGTGLIIVEATGVSPEGRISDRDLGLWCDDQMAGHRQLVEAVHAMGAKIAIQLGHAGRKCEVAGIDHLAPSAIDFNPTNYPCPKELTIQEIKQIEIAFVEAAKRAYACGYDGVEIHAAHGYLLHSFLSPLSNHRLDDYGQTLENRVRLVRDILSAVRDITPPDRALWLRVSATDYLPGGIEIDEMCRVIDHVKSLVDVVHVSSGGLLDAPIKLYAGYQVHLAQTIKETCHVPVIAVGLITEAGLAQNILADERADFVALGRVLLREPYWPLAVAKMRHHETLIPMSYRRGF